ncbi:unnamed protein product, partial [Rotaria magnacalcarata]
MSSVNNAILNDILFQESRIKRLKARITGIPIIMGPIIRSSFGSPGIKCTIHIALYPNTGNISG